MTAPDIQAIRRKLEEIDGALQEAHVRFMSGGAARFVPQRPGGTKLFTLFFRDPIDDELESVDGDDAVDLEANIAAALTEKHGSYSDPGMKFTAEARGEIDRRAGALKGLGLGSWTLLHEIVALADESMASDASASPPTAAWQTSARRETDREPLPKRRLNVSASPPRRRRQARTVEDSGRSRRGAP